MTGRLFVFGLGYSATALARELLAEGWSVSGTCRTPETVRSLAALGIDAMIWDGAAPDGHLRQELRRSSHLLDSIPPGEAGDPVIQVMGETLADLPACGWVGYLSTVGVYGDTGGAPVDETTPPSPDTDRARRRVLAEDQWLELGRRRGLPVHVFRLPGIYGPGRSALDKVRAGRAAIIDKPGHRFSRVHVADIAGVLKASMGRPRPGAIYNVCDAEPAEPGAVNRLAHELLGRAPPPPIPFDEAVETLSPMARSFWRDNRLVIAQKIREELGYELKYPSYREGLRAVLEEENKRNSGGHASGIQG